MIKNEFDDCEHDEKTKGSMSNTSEENGTSHSLSQLKSIGSILLSVVLI